MSAVVVQVILQELISVVKRKMSATGRLREIYYNTQNPASLSRPEVLARAADVSKKVAQSWLRSQPTYTLHKSARKRYPTRRYVVSDIDSQWQCDLADMQQLARYNSGYKYILTVIDILSRFAWARPLKSKQGVEVANAFRSIFDEGRIPKRIQSDQGKEFENRLVGKVMQENNVELFSVKSAYKAAMVERFNRTLKTKIWRYFTAKNTFKWIDELQNFVRAYNHSVHRSIKMKPNDVTPENAMDVWIKQYGNLKVNGNYDVKFEVGDRVKISKVKSVFEKGYLPNWTEEEFFVDEVNTKYQPITYKLIDYHGNSIEGSFYKEEIQKVERDDEVFLVEKIVTRQRRGDKDWYLVKWRGYPASFNSWISEDDLQNVSEHETRRH